MEQKLTQEQKLTWRMTQQLSQAIEILQYNGYDLHQYLQEQMNENPLIEVETTGEEQFSSIRRRFVSHGTDLPEDFFAPPKSLYDLVKEQMVHYQLTPEQRNILEYGIDSLDERGYLTVSLEEWADHCNSTIHLTEECLHILQSMDPPGIGARSLQECLTLQLIRKQKPEPFIDLVQNHIDWVADHNVGQIAQTYNISQEEAAELIQEIQSLTPHPGLQLQQKKSDYIIPDGEVIREQGIWKVKLYVWNSPRVSIDRSYLVQEQLDQETKEFVNKFIRHGNWLIRALETRRQNLLNVFEKVVEKQVAFFHYGSPMLRPLTLQEVAGEIGLHVSTVSRAVKDKYLQTPHGVFPVKFFFQQGIQKKDGGLASAHSTQVLIRELVAGEDPSSPLSDEQIREKLKKGFGIHISRRTVAKYREFMHIPSSFKRKRRG